MRIMFRGLPAVLFSILLLAFFILLLFLFVNLLIFLLPVILVIVILGYIFRKKIRKWIFKKVFRTSSEKDEKNKGDAIDVDYKIKS